RRQHRQNSEAQYAARHPCSAANKLISCSPFAVGGGDLHLRRWSMALHVQPIWLRCAVGAAIVATVLGGRGGTASALEPNPGAEQVRPFRIALEDAVLHDLNNRLARTRWPNQIDGSGWEYGVPITYMKELVDYWQSKYDWRQEERKLNELDQFMT